MFKIEAIFEEPYLGKHDNLSTSAINHFSGIN